jgi:membrane protein
MVMKIVQEVFSKSVGTISISIIFTVWSAGKGLYALTKGLHIIYKTNEEESTNYIYLRIRAIGETILFIALIALGLVSMVFGENLISIIQNKFGGFENFSTISLICTKILFIFLTTLIFVIIYKFLPKHKVTFKSQIYGAVFGAISLNVVSFVFSKYLDIFKGFSITYGSLTTLMLIMMWIYSCFYTVFLGAEINKLINKKKRKKSQNKGK